GHGTGHGIGHFLCVHEGPQNIRTRDNGIELLEGMLISNEPGLYRTGEYGIRSENMILVQKSFHSKEFGDFLQFETLTLFPFDKSLIETQLMTENEIEWINDYHQRVYDKIGQSLAPECREWLREKTSPLEIP
ncbi:MAG: M24 family metallopeptidase C-terminal domain-containing protein, partial [Paludibacteraceae bacterium]